MQSFGLIPAYVRKVEDLIIKCCYLFMEKTRGCMRKEPNPEHGMFSHRSKGERLNRLPPQLYSRLFYDGTVYEPLRAVCSQVKHDLYRTVGINFIFPDSSAI